MNKRIVLGLVILLLSITLYYTLYSETETFETLGQTSESELASEIFRNFRGDMEYAEYLNMLSATDNISYNLIEQEVFFYFKGLANRGSLSVDDIQREIK